MRHEIVMPRLSDAVEDGVVVTWFVEPDTVVQEGDLVAEIQVEKSAAEVRAPASGRMAELLVTPGGVVRQGAPIAVLATEEVEAAAVSPGPAAEAATPATVGVPSAPGPIPIAGTRPISPAARRLAAELGVDLATAVGSGPGGRIVETDVRAAAAGLIRAPAVPGQTAAHYAPTARVEPLSQTRRVIAERLVAGLATTAQVTLTTEADVTDLAAELRRLSGVWGRRASYTEAVVRACALALRKHPRIGALWTDAGLTYTDRIDIGVAVAIEDGLIVPVIRGADQKSLEELNREVAELAERAPGGGILPRETEGGMFSVSNLGAYGMIDAFTPLLNPPQTAILGIGRARPRPAVVDGVVVARTLVVLSLTFDHRVIDGAPAAAYLADVVALLADPPALESG